jgi:hypothetical protein
MDTDTLKVPVEYIITTTSDWTMFEIVEGGWWQDLHIECKEGRDRLTRDITRNNRSIRIDKESEDEKPVVVIAKCVLNIQKEHRHSELKYKLTKGDRQSTIIMIAPKRKEPFFFVNKGTVDGDPCNPVTFSSPVQEYLPDLRKEKVFIIHGKDKYQALLLNKYLNSHKVDAIVLDDIANKGKTIIEQIEYVQSRISYAFAILTPDDVGCLHEDFKEILAVASGPKATSKEVASKVLGKLQTRARQNVLFELGLFIGTLGRENVCYLKQKSLKEIPSDLDGVLYKEFDKSVEEVFYQLSEELFGTQ